MARLREYHRPETMAEALALLARPGINSVPLAGGMDLVPQLVTADNAIEAAVDLGRLGLDFIELEGETIRLGATTTLADVTKDPLCQRVAGGLMSRTAQLNAVANMRNVATVGGMVVGGDPVSEFLLAFLVLGAEVVVQLAPDQVRILSLDAFLSAPDEALAVGRLSSRHGLLTEVRFLVPRGCLGTGLSRVGRTPHDRPIVAAAAIVACEGNVATHVGLAMSGIAQMQVQLSEVERALEGKPFTDEILAGGLEGLAERLVPPDDFRGGAAYRRAMAPVIAQRALMEAWGMAAG